MGRLGAWEYGNVGSADGAEKEVLAGIVTGRGKKKQKTLEYSPFSRMWQLRLSPAFPGCHPNASPLSVQHSFGRSLANVRFCRYRQGSQDAVAFLDSSYLSMIVSGNVLPRCFAIETEARNPQITPCTE